MEVGASEKKKILGGLRSELESRLRVGYRKIESGECHDWKRNSETGGNLREGVLVKGGAGQVLLFAMRLPRLRLAPALSASALVGMG